jgi:hypothetical protein
LKQTLRIALLLTVTCAALSSFSNIAQAQKIDAAFGISTVEAPGASSAGSDQAPVSLTGGAYPGFSGDVLFWHNVGVGGEIFWKGSQGGGFYLSEDGVNYRPLFYAFNAVYSPKLASHTYLELVGGIGVMSTRFYECNQCQQFGGSSLVATSHHFMGDFGGGIKFYPKGGFFVRPEARIYLINNDTNYSGSYATRFGVSIGYTFGK